MPDALSPDPLGRRAAQRVVLESERRVHRGHLRLRRQHQRSLTPRSTRHRRRRLCGGLAAYREARTRRFRECVA